MGSVREALPSMRGQPKPTCSDLITSGRLLDYIPPFLLGLIENIRGILLALSKNLLELWLLATFGEAGAAR
jgi:hypothetical protein